MRKEAYLNLSCITFSVVRIRGDKDGNRGLDVVLVNFDAAYRLCSIK